MIEDRLDKMESMLVQLVQMVAENNRTTKGISLRMDKIEQRMDQSEEKSEQRHQEYMNKFDEIKLDQDFIYEKTTQNEREMALIKRKYSL